MKRGTKHQTLGAGASSQHPSGTFNRSSKIHKNVANQSVHSIDEGYQQQKYQMILNSMPDEPNTYDEVSLREDGFPIKKSNPKSLFR